jgi:hypothetical protein
MTCSWQTDCYLVKAPCQPKEKGAPQIVPISQMGKPQLLEVELLPNVTS